MPICRWARIRGRTRIISKPSHARRTRDQTPFQVGRNVPRCYHAHSA